MGAFGIGPSLALRAGKGGRAAFDFMGGGLPPGAVLTRASAGMRCNAAGLLVSEGADVARFDHDPVTLAPAGLLLEAARINTISPSEQFDSGAWLTSGATITANDRLAPDGLPSADKAVIAAGAVVQRSSVVAAGTTVAISCWLYAATPVSDVQIGLFDNIAGGQYVSVTVPAGSWTRVMATRTFASGTTDRRIQLLPPAGGATLWLWGAQAEAAATASSYIPTVSEAAGRSADMLTLAMAVADGPATLRVTFDDLSTQDVGVTVSGGSAVLPVNALSRPRVRRIERI